MATEKEKEASIYESLANIQAKLSVPKTHKNQFGGYLFRNTSDILDAAKPLAKAEGCSISINDELVLIGDRFYIKATAALTNSKGETASTTAFAREELSKKGLDASQVTGAASSYARKYALNGLFAIDDTADADQLNTSSDNTQPNNAAPQPNAPIPPTTPNKPTAPAPAPASTPQPAPAQLAQLLAAAKTDAYMVQNRNDFAAWWSKYSTLQNNQEFRAVAQAIGKKFPKTE